MKQKVSKKGIPMPNMRQRIKTLSPKLKAHALKLADGNPYLALALCKATAELIFTKEPVDDFRPEKRNKKSGRETNGKEVSVAPNSPTPEPSRPKSIQPRRINRHVDSMPKPRRSKRGKNVVPKTDSVKNK